MSFNLKVGGTWQELVSGWVKVAGTWQQIQSAWVKVAGTWQQVYDLVSYALSGESGIQDLQTQPTTARAGIRINADGTIDKREQSTYTQIDSATDWCIPNGSVTGSEEFYCTDNNANLAGGSSATLTWLTAPCEWYIENATATPKSLNITVQVRPASGEPAADSGVYTGTATSEP